MTWFLNRFRARRARPRTHVTPSNEGVGPTPSPQAAYRLEEGRFLMVSSGATQGLQNLLDEIDAQCPLCHPFFDADNRFLVSTLPVETAVKVANGMEVIAQSLGPSASPHSAQQLKGEIEKVVSG